MDNPAIHAGDHPQFSELMAGAHRRRVTPLGSPSLVLHRAYWKPIVGEPENHSDGQSQQVADRSTATSPTANGSARITALLDQRNAEIDRAVSEIYQVLKSKESKEKESKGSKGSKGSKKTAEGNERAEDRTIHGLRYGGPAPIRETEVSDPDWAMLFTRPMNCLTGITKNPEPGSKNEPYGSIKFSFYWHGISITTSFESHVEFTTLTVTADFSDKNASDYLSKIRNNEFHNEIEHTLSQIAKCRPTTLHQKWHDRLYKKIWNKFDEEILSKVDVSSTMGERFVDFRGLVVESAQPLVCRILRTPLFTPPYHQVRWRSGFDKQHKPRCTLDVLEKVHPFLRCTLPDDTEFTVSRVLDGRAFFAAALGRQARYEDHANTEPLTYFIYEDTLNAWQLGRLVYRLNRAGTARIAATMHFETLRKTGETLRIAASRLTSALAGKSSSEGDSIEALKELTKTTRKEYRKIEVDLLPLMSSDLDGSLYYRIERSKYYKSQFDRVVQSLRIRRVEGYQQYDEFVEQRLGPVYEYIRRLGDIYERVQSDRSLLLRRLQSQDALFEEKQISKIQRTAEFALFLILGPYYLGSVLAHVFPDLSFTRAIWTGAFVGGIVSFVAYRISERIGLSLACGTAGAMAAGVLLFCFGDSPSIPH